MTHLKEEPLRIFILSATEGLSVAESVKKQLEIHSELSPYVWKEAGVFEPSRAFIESLEKQLVKNDFAIFSLTPDDKVNIRGEERTTPRDNILFELGLFMGGIGRDRTFFLYDDTDDLKLPSDLYGIAGVSYKLSLPQNDPKSLTCACSGLADYMIGKGPRFKTSPEMNLESRQTRNFCGQIAGTWWARQVMIRPEATRLAFVRFIPDEPAGTVQVVGSTFDQEGTLFGRWNSTAIGVVVPQRMVMFAWQGEQPKLSPGKTFAGFGRYLFDPIENSAELCNRGHALFANIEEGGNKSAHWASVDLRRVDAEDLDRITRVMSDGSDQERAAEIVRVLASFSRVDNPKTASTS